MLKAHGYKTVLRPKADSLAIIDDVGDPASGVDVGFAAQDLRRTKTANVASLGQTELQPLFMFYRASLGVVSSLGDLRGRRVVMPPVGSATTQAALAVMKLFGLTDKNTSFTYLPLSEAVGALDDGSFDLGLFMLPPDNEFITRLARSATIRMVDNDRSAAVGRLLPFLVPITLPRGVYDVAADVPPRPLAMLAAPVEVLVRKDIQPGLAYALLDAMTQTHRAATLVSSGGEFPSPSTDGPIMLPVARSFYREGVPTVFRVLPRYIAGFVDSYLILVITLLVVGQTWDSWKKVRVAVEGVLGQAILGILIWLHRSSKRRQGLSRSHAAMIAAIERTLQRTTSKQRRDALIAELKALSKPGASSDAA